MKLDFSCNECNEVEGEIISLQRDRLSVMQIFGGKSSIKES